MPGDFSQRFPESGWKKEDAALAFPGGRHSTVERPNPANTAASAPLTRADAAFITLALSEAARGLGQAAPIPR